MHSVSIRIRINFGRLNPDPHWECGSGSRSANYPQKYKKGIFLPSKPWIWIRIDLKCWARIRIENNADPKHCDAAALLTTPCFAAAALAANVYLTLVSLQDFYDKYEAYMTVMHERKERTIR
jgi:hypothetical protein